MPRVFPADALADPVRRAIVERLARGDVGAGDIAAAFPVSRPAISRHLRVLREAGLVTSRVAGQHRIYALDTEIRRGRRARRTNEQEDDLADTAG